MLLLALACSDSADDAATAIGPPPLLRLTEREFDRTVQDLFGRTDLPMQVFPSGQDIDGFDNQADGQAPSAYLVERYQAAASELSWYALDAPRFWACEYTGDGAERFACAQASVLKFAARAWRGPLSDEEKARLVAFLQARYDDRGDAEVAAVLAVEAILLSPRFLYRIEPPGPPDDFVVAARLSYLLWDSMPDDELFAAADAGNLSSEVGVKAQAARMLADWRARDAVVDFHAQWLKLAQIQQIDPNEDTYFTEIDRDNYSDHLSTVRAVYDLETQLFIEAAVFSPAGGSYRALMTDNRSWVSPETAPLYGVSPADSPVEGHVELPIPDEHFSTELYAVELPEDQRAGILTLGGPMASLAHPVHPSPIKRGAFVLGQVLCRDLGTPPPGSAALGPADEPDAAGTNRQRYDSSTATATCAGCHVQINPIGFAFEHYDAVGAWQDQDNGQPVDATGTISLDGTTVAFDDAVELAHALAESREAHDCYVSQWYRYSLGRASTDAEAGALQAVQDNFWSSGGDIRGMLSELATRFARAGVE